jgi:hypothetical protein
MKNERNIEIINWRAREKGTRRDAERLGPSWNLGRARFTGSPWVWARRATAALRPPGEAGSSQVPVDGGEEPRRARLVAWVGLLVSPPGLPNGGGRGLGGLKRGREAKEAGSLVGAWSPSAQPGPFPPAQWRRSWEQKMRRGRRSGGSRSRRRGAVGPRLRWRVSAAVAVEGGGGGGGCRWRRVAAESGGGRRRRRWRAAVAVAASGGGGWWQRPGSRRGWGASLAWDVGPSGPGGGTKGRERACGRQ